MRSPKLITSGATRIVILVGPYAIKIPNFREWRLFLRGLLSNMEERLWSGKHPNLARVFCSSRLGLWLVMERCTPCFLLIRLTDDDYYYSTGRCEMKEFDDATKQRFQHDDYSNLLLSDNKSTNWGLSPPPRGDIVKIDYGS